MAPTDAAVAAWSHACALDLVVAGFDGFPLKCLVGTVIGNGDGTFRSLNTYVPSIQTDFTAPWGIASGDFNGDGWQDFVVTHQATQRGYQIYMNNQNSATFNQQTIQILPSDIPGFVTAAD